VRAACPHIYSRERAFIARRGLGLIVRTHSGSGISKFRSVVVGLDRFGPAAVCVGGGFQNSFRICARTAVGNDLLLWNVLVTNLSDDPLRQSFRLARVSAALATSHPGFSLSRIGLCVPRANHSSIRRKRDLHSADSLDFV